MANGAGAGRFVQRRFLLTPDHPCGYLAGRQARTLFLHPDEPHGSAEYQALAVAGFRRAGEHLYRPRCAGCQACVPARVPVERFVLKRRFRRVLARNEDVSVRVEPAGFDEARYDLYERYIAVRHAEGDMHPASPEQFRSFLDGAAWSGSFFLCGYLDGALVVVAATDAMAAGLSAIFTFFEPRLEARSLGVYAVLRQIEECRRRGLTHLYLGYWIAEAAKMRYKADYRPIELLTNRGWVEADQAWLARPMPRAPMPRERMTL